MVRRHHADEHAQIHRVWSTRGVMTARELIAAGLSEAEIRRYAHRGWLARVARGVYASSRVPATAGRPILVAAARVPTAVVTGPAALYLHGLLDEAPSEIWLAIPASSRRPRVGGPVRFVWSEIADVAIHRIEGVDVRVATPERAIRDCVRRGVRGLVGGATCAASPSAVSQSALHGRGVR